MGQATVSYLCIPMIKAFTAFFLFGANHTMKGESYLPVYDIGTTANIFSQAEGQDSYHIIVLPKSGKQAGFITGSGDLDMNDGIFRSLMVLLDKASATEWTTINLEPIRTAIRKQNFIITDDILKKTMYGYDALVVIPVATAAEAVR
jgi:hypothetical protein